MKEGFGMDSIVKTMRERAYIGFSMLSYPVFS